jgi:hypothetical protein
MTKRLSLLTVFCVAAALACTATPMLAQSAGIAAARPGATMDAELAAINDAIPGFGGMFVDFDGTLAVYLQRDRGLRYRHAFGPGVRVLEGRWEFRQLADWRARLRPFLASSGIVHLDVDETRNRVRVGVDTGTPAGTRRALAVQLRALGIPRAAVDFVDAEPIVALQTLSDPFNPIPGGVEIHWSNFLCTLGFNVKRGPSSDPAEACYFVTNDHCTDVQGSVTGTTYRQPAFGALIGVEILDPPFFSGGVCPVGRICRYSDAALAEYFTATDCEFAKIARTFLGSTTIDPANPRWTIVAKVGSPLAGSTVAKVGRTTGWTENVVSQTCVDTNVSGSNITRLCQSIVNAGVGGGDSGSPVFHRRIPTSQAALGGILWGGNLAGTLFVFSPVENIEKDFGFALTVF